MIRRKIGIISITFMVAFAHSAVGIIIGVVAFKTFGQENPALGLLATGFATWIMHYIFDFFPHGHYFRGEGKFKKNLVWVLLLDVALPVIFFLYLAYLLGKSQTEILYLFFGIGGSQLPDVLSGLRSIKILPKTSVLNFEFVFHMSTHWHGLDKKALLFTAWDIWQVGLLFLATYFLIK